jgi:membrane associated rhomboid family serine protease
MNGLKKLRNRFERFCFRHRNVGVPNLMLFVCLGAGLVYLMSYFAQNYELYYWLAFDRRLILQGQVWRLFTYPLTYGTNNLVLTAISLVCYWSLGTAVERQWGTLRFNLYYFTGMLLMDVFALAFGGWADATHLNLSLFLAYATMYPDAQFLLLFVIPVKAWIFALVDLGLVIYDVVYYSSYGLFPFSLFPLVALLNYFLFFGKEVRNVLPPSLRRRNHQRPTKRAKPTTIQFHPAQKASNQPVSKEVYTHRCTICGRTDVSNPELEFRYCSRCNGYYCYCQDHISNHTHM